jgi:hypothetical protein
MTIEERAERDEKIMEQTYAFIAKVKANPQFYIDYVNDKPNRHRLLVAELQQKIKERREKALNESLSI